MTHKWLIGITGGLFLVAALLFSKVPFSFAQTCSGTVYSNYTYYNVDTRSCTCIPTTQVLSAACYLQYLNTGSGYSNECGSCIRQSEACTAFWNYYGGQYGNPNMLYCDYTITPGTGDGICPAGYSFSPSGCNYTPLCDTGISCSSCASPQYNSCYAGNSTGTNCVYTAYSGGGSCIQTGAPNQGGWCTIYNCNTGAGYYACSNGNCVTHIYANVYTDYNHDGAKDGNDAGKQGVNVSDGYNTFGTDANGNVTFSGLQTGGYTISETVPANFQAVNASSQGVTLSNNTGNQTVNFYVTPLYSIAGRVFNDVNKDQKYDGSDTGYGGGTINISGGPTPVGNITVEANGTWSTATNLESGTYTVTYTSGLPAGYTFTTPSSYTVTVGDPAGSPVCNTGGSLDATCGGTNNGSIANLDIGVSNENAWHQSVCFDVRDDSGTYNNLIPASPSCGGVSGAYDSITNANCSTGAGIVFSCNATPNFGLGASNANNWQAGGPTNNEQECYVGPGLNNIRTSYNYLLTTARQSNITLIDMATVCGAGGLANCTLPATLAKGIYLANGDVYLNAYTFPVDPTNPQSFTFLINGNLHILGNIIVPAGSVAAFSASGNVYVDKSVGNVITSASDPANNNPNLEGLYSADASFIVESNAVGNNKCNIDGTPLDKKLNVVGSIVTNAAQGGGSFQDNRDLCIFDTQCPAASVGDGTDSNSGLALSYLLTLYADGKFLNHQIYNWQELRP